VDDVFVGNMASNNSAGMGSRPVGTANPVFQVTENLTRHKLCSETENWKKKSLLRIPDQRPNQEGPYIFFQILNHKSPDGNIIWYSYIPYDID